jgi:hypothetical protein
LQICPGKNKTVPRLHLNGKRVDTVVHASDARDRRKHKLGGSWSKPAWAKSETLSQK